MARRLLSVVLLIALIGQSVAAARTGLTLDFVADLQHAVLHWQGEGHHHHDDGGYHADDSNESSQHLIADFVMGSPALTADVNAVIPFTGSYLLVVQRTDHIPDPYLEGPLRPPRSTS
jgi:hypothetical protein